MLFNGDNISFKNQALRDFEAFLDCLNYCSLCELPAKGQDMTWINNRNNDDLVWERLDRVTLNGLKTSKKLPSQTYQFFTRITDLSSLIQKEKKGEKKDLIDLK